MESSLEKQLVELYLAGADIIGEGLPAPLNRPRAGALETFNLLGIPPRGSGYGDRYHYTDLRNLFQQEYERYFTPSYPSAALAMPETEGERLSLLNGFCTSEQPLTRSENGVIFGSLAAAAKAYPELVERYFNQLAESQGDAVSALNTVFAQDGAFVYVPQGVRAERPFVISFSYYSEGESLAGFARNLFVFESGSRAQVVIENRSASDETYFDCQVREVFAAEDARADIVELFRLNGRSSIVSGSFTEQQASSRVHTLSVGLEGRLIRGDQHVALKGRGAENHTDGLMLSGAGQHIDFTTGIFRAIAPVTKCSRGLLRTAEPAYSAAVFTWRRTPRKRRLTSKATTCCSATERIFMRNRNWKFMPTTSNAATGPPSGS